MVAREVMGVREPLNVRSVCPERSEFASMRGIVVYHGIECMVSCQHVYAVDCWASGGRSSACLCEMRNCSVSRPCVCRNAWACVVSLLVDLRCMP